VRTSSLDVADIFRAMGPSYRLAQAGRLSVAQLKVMSAIQNCRTAALGGHVDGCDDCGYPRVAYNSCRNRHCPKYQAAAAKAWLAERKADLLPVGYFHVVFTLPAEIADIAWQNKAVVYDLLFRTASETMMTIAADPKHLGACIGITALLVFFGRLAERHRRDLSFLASVALFTAASAACAMANSVETLVAFRIAQAAGGGAHDADVSRSAACIIPC
jgi:hypothetical protein